MLTERRLSRELALQIMYQREHGREDGEQAVRAFASHFRAPAKLMGYARRLVLGVAEEQESLDQALQKASPHWKLERMSHIDRNILRLAAYEIIHGQAPVKVAINEAVELAKSFGGESSPSFVNGVLDALARQMGAVEERSGMAGEQGFEPR
ncbi:MAG: transcription antitermination factor NusB [Desulfarculales bacterium]|nr:transcription antitermination factor NusB [Desulfarculales bacterium]